MHRLFPLGVLAFLVASQFPGVAAAVEAPDADPGLLTIGSVAPALDIEHWVQDGNGAFGKVDAFQEGEVYVVEFWATWCAPCIASMPHLVDLQQKYADRGVQIVSVTDEPLETVIKFLDRKVGKQTNDAGEPLTFRELTSTYCLTADPDKSTKRDYMRAAKQNGIPCAFVVGKDGRVEWIGHPREMDEALEQVVTDSWDRDAFAEEFRSKQRFDEQMQRALRLVTRGKPDEAKEMLADLAADAPTPGLARRARMMVRRVDVITCQRMMQQDPVGAAEKFPEIIETLGGNDLAKMAAARMVLAQGARGAVAPELVEAAVSVTKQVVEGDAQIPLTMFTYAGLLRLQGDLDGAIAAAEQAAESSQRREKVYATELLSQLRAEKEIAEEAADSAMPEGDSDADDE